MDTNQKIITMDMKLKFLALWIFVFLNMIFRDLHELGRPGLLQEIMTGVVNGVQITDSLMLIGGIMIEIPLLMLPLSQLLPFKANRLANIWIGTLMIPLMIFVYNPPDLDDIFFLVFEIAALLLIIWYAWRWSNTSQPLGKNASISKGNI
jgi:hypothetical protein